MTTLLEQAKTAVTSVLGTGETWQSKAAAKRAKRDALIPEHLKLKSLPKDLDVTKFDFSSVLSSQEIAITETEDIIPLLEAIKTKKWSAVEVVSAFGKRALVATQLTNCLTEICMETALVRAKELDEHLAKTGNVVGPLHGLPISLKDQIDLEGVEMTMGYVGWIGNVSERNAVLVDLLVAQGAVPYVRTNVPQALMFSESYNNLWGRTLNPFNTNLTCGGSSGGEGALIAMRGSFLGVGSDLGGSVRIPAAFQGLYGLRPSYNRIPYMHTTNSMEGQEAVPSVLGPMSISPDGLKLFTKAIADAKPWLYDPIALRMPWNEEAYNLVDHGKGEKLCFGMMWDDGVCRPHPPYVRAMQKTRAALEAAGHTVIEWKAIDHAESNKIIHAIYNADAGHDIKSVLALSGEPHIGWVMNKQAKHLDTYSYWQLSRAKLAFIKKQLDRWEATVSQTGTGRPVDAIICPVSANCPGEHDVPQYINYTSFVNLTDYAASNFPVTRVDPSVDVKEPAPSSFLSEDDKRVFELYEPETFKNAPIGLQCIGRKNEEEAVIRMTEIIDAALKAAK